MDLSSGRWRFLTKCGGWPLPPEAREQHRSFAAQSAALLYSTRCVLRARVFALWGLSCSVFSRCVLTLLCVFTQKIWHEWSEHGFSSDAHCLCRLPTAFMLSQHLLSVVLAFADSIMISLFFFQLVHNWAKISNLHWFPIADCNGQILSYAHRFTHLNSIFALKGINKLSL